MNKLNQRIAEVEKEIVKSKQMLKERLLKETFVDTLVADRHLVYINILEGEVKGLLFGKQAVEEERQKFIDLINNFRAGDYDTLENIKWKLIQLLNTQTEEK